MTNPASTHRAPTRAASSTKRARSQRRTLATALPVGSCLAACVLLAAAAAVDGRAAALVLAVWVALLVVAGMWMTFPSRGSRAPQRPMLVLADLDEDGEVGDPRHLPLVATPAAAHVIRARPRG